MGDGGGSGLCSAMGGRSLPDRPFLELALFEEIGDAGCFPQGYSVTAGEREVEFASRVCDERVRCCLRRDV